VNTFILIIFTLISSYISLLIFFQSNDEAATRRNARKRRAERVHALLEKRRKRNDADVSTSDPAFVFNFSGRLYVAPSGEVDGTVGAQAGNSQSSASLELIGVEPTESLAESRSQPSSPRAHHQNIEVNISVIPYTSVHLPTVYVPSIICNFWFMILADFAYPKNHAPALK
jgi:hypothetical protein